MKTGKRVLACIVLALCLLGTAWYLTGGDSAVLNDWRDSDRLTPEQLLCDRLTAQAERIYLYPYDITDEELFDLWALVCGNHPKLFFVSTAYTYYASGDRVLYVCPQYTMDPDTALSAEQAYDAAVQNALAGVEDDWSDLETALYLHDWIALHARYDDDIEHFKAYDLFINGTGVCQAYAQAYLALMQQCGIDCQIVTSDAINHAWVIIRLDGAWYHVDVTHDDPLQDRLGHAQHTYFLRSDEALRTSHFGGDAPVACDSTAYDTAVWDDVTSAFVPVNGAFYCISGNQLCRWDDAQLTPLYTIRDRWYVDGDRYSYWDGCFSALAADGNTLLFNTPDAVMRYDIAAGTVSAAGHYDGAGDIYGFTYENGAARCQVGREPNDAETVVHLQLTA